MTRNGYIWTIAALCALGVGAAIFAVDTSTPGSGAKDATAQAATAVVASTPPPAAAQGNEVASPWTASPFVKGPASPQPASTGPGPVERMLDIPALQARWAGDPRRDEKIGEVIAVTRLQDRIGGIGETLAGLPPEARRGEVEILVTQMQAFAARGVLPKEEVEDVEAQLLALVDPDANRQDNGQPRRHGPRGFR
ncbi:hypothetical protein NU688_19550 [Variovorax sp. ZS18.2.2]|uniref:hypothetical protein n=1 Tax=Variovorax sp. ZS18.2.2 TaxID=2971255 RepID=UPI002151934A|nr:hypothetical protein [Variovorax sp. ZS18.2.2]MCR6478365.1 hypothetical protein [Variovorax sp. ZS18.2.2]